MKHIFFFCFLALPLLATAPACESLNAGYGMKGTINNAANLQVLLEQVFFDPGSTAVAFGRATCDASGNFTLEQKEAFPAGLYRLTIGAKRLFFMLGGDEKTVELKGDLNTLDRLQVEVAGSETFACYAKVVREIIEQGQMNEDAAKDFAKKGCNPLMQAFLTMQLLGRNAGVHIQEFKAVQKALEEAMPKSKYATEFALMIGNLERQMAMQQGGGEGPIQVGQPAPEISLPGPDGKTRSLSSLKGKVVLIDFWASWCRPCRMANPHVVEVYKKYKSKGFEVFSVSLDRPGQKDAWVNAIKQDGLVWDNHVSDLQFWKSAPAATYGVQSIPKTFLVDRNGNIAALNPRENLESEVQKLVN